MSNILFNLVATLITAWVVVNAFDPKYRYNEHRKWTPEPSEIIWIMSVGLFIIWRIWV